MNRKQLLVVGSVLVVAIATIFLLGRNRNSTTNNSILINFQTTSTVVSQMSSTPSSTILNSPKVPLWGEYHVSLPDSLVLLDSKGRRTGKDPVTGTLYHEIPGTSYSEVGSPSTGGAGELLTSNLPNDRYNLYVLGGQTTTYWLDASHSGQMDQYFGGPIKDGSMVAYVQNYDMAHLASSTFSFEGTASSTASITSASPNNLPPPPIP